MKGPSTKIFWGGLFSPSYRFQGAIGLVFPLTLILFLVGVSAGVRGFQFVALFGVGLGLLFAYYLISNFWRLWLRLYVVSDEGILGKRCDPYLQPSKLLRHKVFIPWGSVSRWERWPLRGKGNFEYRLFASDGKTLVWSSYIVRPATELAAAVSKYAGEPVTGRGDHRSGPDQSDPEWRRPWAVRFDQKTD
jgi:hypothetical protein